MDTKNLPVVVCYPPGAGGSMLGSALHTIFAKTDFNVSRDGNCHYNNTVNVPHYVPTNDVQGFKNELAVIESIAWQNASVIKGHVRNLVAVQSICYDFWFIKITFDCTNVNEVEFLHRMLSAKVSMKERLLPCYDQIRFDDWPTTIDEFLKLPNCNELFRLQNYHTLQNWFWVESQSTRARTLELSIQDIFLGIPGEKLSQWYDKQTIDELYVRVKQWQSINNKLYPDAMALLK